MSDLSVGSGRGEGSGGHPHPVSHITHLSIHPPTQSHIHLTLTSSLPPSITHPSTHLFIHPPTHPPTSYHLPICPSTIPFTEYLLGAGIADDPKVGLVPRECTV